ncbi:hypothetical protein [Dermatobacter hominis]|uniref:hypothetical protein n=1 Tax=Dermatobacter hominis TaxID=2884263 RepID=UPI001D1113C8|nr:hypothetical protein [Dermatobacter hominis]UDY33961.1 hypothetical protein LH044_11445 [Dermatobacter hominis]
MTGIPAIEQVEIGRTASFARPPGAAGLDELADAAERALDVTRKIEPMVHEGAAGPVDVTMLAAAYDLGLGLVASRSSRVELLATGANGEHIREPAEQLQPGFTLDRNDGFLVRDAATVSPAINLLAGRMAVAASARVAAWLVFGSIPFQLGNPAVERLLVIPMNGGIVLRPRGAPPIELEAGNAASVDGWPRIHSQPAVCTLFVGVESFSGEVLRSALIERAAHHPLLRLDAPVTIGAPVEVYGVNGLVDYADLVAEAVRRVQSDTSIDELAWWWTLAASLPAVGTSGAHLERIRGRFPGGVGIAGDTDDGRLLLRTGGATVAVHGDLLPWLTELVAGEVVGCPEFVHRASADVLLRMGVVEPVFGTPRAVVPPVGVGATSGEGA